MKYFLSVEEYSRCLLNLPNLSFCKNNSTVEWGGFKHFLTVTHSKNYSYSLHLNQLHANTQYSLIQVSRKHIASLLCNTFLFFYSDSYLSILPLSHTPWNWFGHSQCEKYRSGGFSSYLWLVHLSKIRIEFSKPPQKGQFWGLTLVSRM